MTKSCFISINTSFFHTFYVGGRWILKMIEEYRVQYDSMIINLINKNFFLKNTLVISFQMIVLWLKSHLFPINYRFYYSAVFVVKWILEMIDADRIHNYLKIIYFVKKINFLKNTIVISFHMLDLWLKSCFIPINKPFCHTFDIYKKMNIGNDRCI